MWLQIRNGMYSAVTYPADPAKFQVRTRAKGDAQFLIDWLEREHGVKTEIVLKSPSDYPWRVVLYRELWGSFLVWAAEDIDYGNFKTAVGLVNPKRASVYAGVWAQFLKIEDEDGKSRRYAPWTDYRTPTPSVGQYGITLTDQLAYEHGGLLSTLDDNAPEQAETFTPDGRRVGKLSIHRMTDAEFDEYMESGSVTVRDPMDDEPAPRAKKRKKGKGKSRR